MRPPDQPCRTAADRRVTPLTRSLGLGPPIVPRFPTAVADLVRPSAPQDQRTASTYILGAICPKEGKCAGLILPWCNTEAMSLHLAAIAAKIAAGGHTALLVD
jgi:hypothetical protein